MLALRTELRRSSMLRAAPLLVFLGALATWRGLVHSVSLWDLTGTALLGAVQLMGPIAAGIASWAAGRERRRRLRYLRVLGVRSPAMIPLVQLAALAVWAVAAYGVVALFFVVRAAASDSDGRFSPGPPLAAALGLLVHVVIGYVAGFALPWPITPPLVAISAYVYGGWNLDHGGESWYLLSPVTVERADAFHTWQQGLLARQGLWYALLAGCLVVALAAAVSRTRLLATALAVCVVAAALAAGPVRSFDGHFFAAEPRPFSYACAQSSVRVCVHPAFTPALPQLLASFSSVHRRLDGTPGDVSSLWQLPRAPGARPPAAGQPLYLDDLRTGYAERAAVEFTQSLLDPEACRFDRRPPAAVLRSEAVAGWIAGDLQPADSPFPQQQDVLRALHRMGEEGSQRWLAAHFGAFRSCTLSAADASS